MSDIPAPVTSAEQSPYAPPKGASADASPAKPVKPLRLWPAVVIVVLMWILATVPGLVAPGTMLQLMAMMWGPMVCLSAFFLWWAFASRAPVRERIVGFVSCLVLGTAAYFTYHSTVGVFGLLFTALPVVVTAWLVWLAVTYRVRDPAIRQVGLAIVFALTLSYFSLFRMEGFDGNFKADMRWRWATSAEEKFLAENRAKAAAAKPAKTAAEPLALAPGDWPGFRGANCDGRFTGERFATDWKAHPPQEVWRQRIGPGWSSFAVIGSRLFTQEQRGEQEFVVCYDANSGAEIWAHGDKARFYEALAGAGPRATPTFHEGKLFTLGGAGRLNCLDAASGELKWTQDIKADSNAPLPTWGFSSSPQVHNKIVSVFAGGPGNKRVLAYNASDGKLAWSAGDGGISYCSLQRATLDGVDQLLLTTDAGLAAYDPASGEELWQFEWEVKGMSRCVQPTVLAGSDFLLGTPFGYGTRRVHVSHSGGKWEAEEVWLTKAIKPYFSDLVIYDDHLYGFDGQFFVCVRLEDGKGIWRVRGYDNGQVLLLADQGLLLVLSEYGDVALVEATPQKHIELARFKALTGKTWNHPVISRGLLFVRNGEEMAAYRLAKE